MLDEAALPEAVAGAAVLELDPEGTGSIGQGVDSSFELRPGDGAPSRLTTPWRRSAELLGISRAPPKKRCGVEKFPPSG